MFCPLLLSLHAQELGGRKKTPAAVHRTCIYNCHTGPCLLHVAVLHPHKLCELLACLAQCLNLQALGELALALTIIGVYDSVMLTPKSHPCGVLLQELLLLVSEAPEQEGMSGDMLERGLKLVLDSLDQTAVDVPFAPSLARAQPLILPYHLSLQSWLF